MAFPARAFRVLIASPSDVSRERDLAVQVIQQWNNLNSREREVVLLPVRWETHAAPEMGHPQRVINRQFADEADAVVAIFWTRIGTATLEAASGTIEEIQRADAAGKLVMLYFSDSPASPASIDLDQLGRLREFKSHAWKDALTDSFSDPTDFKEKFSKALDIQVRRHFLASSNASGLQLPPPYTDISLAFADPDSGKQIGMEHALELNYFDVQDFESIPDFEPEVPEPAAADSTSTGIIQRAMVAGTPNRNYYRQAATKMILGSLFGPLRLWFANKGGIGARDVYVELSFSTSEPVLMVVRRSDVKTGEPSKMQGGGLFGFSTLSTRPSEVMRPAEGFDYSFDLGALQPQREISPEVELLVGATKPCTVRIRARIFADTLALPTSLELDLQLDVKVTPVTAATVMAVIE